MRSTFYVMYYCFTTTSYFFLEISYSSICKISTQNFSWETSGKTEKEMGGGSDSRLYTVSIFVISDAEF